MVKVKVKDHSNSARFTSVPELRLLGTLGPRSAQQRSRDNVTTQSRQGNSSRLKSKETRQTNAMPDP